ncbi:MAG TPA: APC family permease, partial [Ignavibacteria bacterium]|nr:APC family permease [Ignavibacteria bacterium]
PDSIAAIEVLRSFMGNAGVMLISLLIMVSTFATTNGTVLASSRLYFAMSKDNLFFKYASTCHKKYKTPSSSLIIQGIWSSALVLSGSFDQLTDMLMFSNFIFYGAGVLGLFVLRKTMKDEVRRFKVFGYPYIPAIALVFFAVILVITVIQRPRDAGIGTVLMLLGFPFYLMWKKKKQPAA